MRTPTPVPSAPPAPGGEDGVGEAVAASLEGEAATAMSTSSGGVNRLSTRRV